MISYLAVGAASIVLCIVVGAGFYIGVRHVEALSTIRRNRDRPEWAQESVDTANRIIGRHTSAESAERLSAADDDMERRE